MVPEASNMKLFVANKLTIGLAKHYVSNGRIMHIERKFYFLYDQVNKQKLEMQYCNINLQFAVIFTKLLKQLMFNEL